MKKDRFIRIGLVVYMSVICYLTLWRIPATASSYKLTLFWSYRVFREQWKQILGNVLLFVPLGGLLYALGKKLLKAMLFGFLLSASVELIQLLGHLGLCELDDVLHNTLGTALGYGLLLVFERYAFFWRK